ncbi:MAG: aminoacyl-tRNA hydrolase [Candidatus Phytoplasma stylosanthis]|nr:aminoacyl-tRNA hydrolase [Candidatus Phytoplasma stylosanthis]
MKLIIGLGNPGSIYKNTPHNVGFMLIDFFLNKLTKDCFRFKKDPKSLLYLCKINKIYETIFMKPQTYMNESGIAIIDIITKYKIKIENILVIHDDIYLKEGFFKLKTKGGHGGHNGIRNIIEILKTDYFKRLKIGVGKDDYISLDKYVLSSFNNKKKEIIQNNFLLFAKIIENFIYTNSFRYYSI